GRTGSERNGSRHAGRRRSDATRRLRAELPWTSTRTRGRAASWHGWKGDDRRLTGRLNRMRHRADGPSCPASTSCSTSTSRKDTRTPWSSPSPRSKIFSASRFPIWRGSAKTGGRSQIAARRGRATQIPGCWRTGRRGRISSLGPLSSSAHPEARPPASGRAPRDQPAWRDRRRGSVIGSRGVVQHDAEQSVVDLEAAVVLDEAELPELVHEEIDA